MKRTRERFTILAEFQPRVEKSLDRLSKKSSKVGDSLTYSISNPRTIVSEDGVTFHNIFTGKDEVRTSGVVVVDVELEYVTTVKDRYSLVRVVEDGETRHFIKSDFELTENHCDHCNTTRARRKYYVLRDGDGNDFQVGSTCLEDFMGRDVYNSMMAELSWRDSIISFEDDWGMGGSHGMRQKPLYKVEDVFRMSTYLTLFSGYVSRTAVRNGWGDKTATADNVCIDLGYIYGYLTPPKGAEWFAEYMSRISAAMERDNILEKADAALEWFNTEKADEDSAFIMTVNEAIQTGYVSEKLIPYLAWIPNAYLKHVEEVAKKEANPAKNSEHVGEVGERTEFNVKIVGHHSFTGRFGQTYIYTMLDASGNQFKTFTNRYFEYEETEEITIKGTVKKHDEYNGIKETVLSRVSGM